MELVEYLSLLKEIELKAVLVIVLELFVYLYLRLVYYLSTIKSPSPHTRTVLVVVVRSSFWKKSEKLEASLQGKHTSCDVIVMPRASPTVLVLVPFSPLHVCKVSKRECVGPR